MPGERLGCDAARISDLLDGFRVGGFNHQNSASVRGWPVINTPSASNLGRVNCQPERFMSQHRSLRAAATLGGKRNVLKRFERIELLKKRGQWKEGDRITGLRKTKGEA